MPFFSVIIPTRNRPALFRHAFESVLAQSYTDIEIVVVNDGSSLAHQEEYRSIIGTATSLIRVRSFNLAARPQGHGQSFSINFGAEEARGSYLCFLDDDDRWIDQEHLLRAHLVLSESGSPTDLFMCNQTAFLGDNEKPGPMWLGGLPATFAKHGNRPDEHGSYSVTIEQLLQTNGFCHLNTLIVRRTLFETVGGMENTIRWECDHDLYLRLIDRASNIKYMPLVVSRHNIPNPVEAASMTTSLSEIERRLIQLIVFYRARFLSRHPAIRAHGRQHAIYTLKRVTEALANNGCYPEAASYAREAFRSRPTIKWGLYAFLLTFRALTDRHHHLDRTRRQSAE